MRSAARWSKFDDFSAHADRSELLDFVRTQQPERLRQIFLVHGEEDQALPFRETLEDVGFRSVHFPALGELARLD